MKVVAEFKNGMCRLFLTPEDQWEKLLLGAVAKGGEKMSALVTYKPAGHVSYGMAEEVQIQLEAGDA